MLFKSASLRSAQYIQIAAAVGFVWLFLIFFFRYDGASLTIPTNSILGSPNKTPLTGRPSADVFDSINTGAQYFLDYPLAPPYKDIFGELGERAKVLRSWIEELDIVKQTPFDENDKDALEARETAANTVQRVAESLFPYLKTASDSPDPLSPLTTIRRRILDANQTDDAALNAGIVIPTGDHTLRFACHLIASLTRVHNTKLPIQVVYAGDDDLSVAGREALEQASHGVDIEFVDILEVFSDAELKLAEGGWAIKPFAALASRFDQVILLDADTVFLQDPVRLLTQKRFEETGALLFHDRLLWKNGFKERQDWWHEQIKHPSAETNKSLVWTERYSEEGDSGLVVVDKSRLDVLIGLLHIGWQNSFAVRDQWTYRVTYGDKETWWIGFEATGSQYAFSKHYGGMIGWPKKDDSETEEQDKLKEDEVRVCSFVIAHVDEKEQLLWYNGGLLKNKLANMTEFEVPTHLMMDQEWHKGSKKTMSCMVGKDVKETTEHERDVLGQCIDIARDVDERLHLIPPE
ncbi:Fc.00g021540.m01.CDS01 [Cosmosporella sp. VM-42]